MFGVGMGEFLGLIVLGLFLVGPDKLPNAAKDFARFLHKVRNFTSYASRELKENQRCQTSEQRDQRCRQD